MVPRQSLDIPPKEPPRPSPYEQPPPQGHPAPYGPPQQYGQAPPFDPQAPPPPYGQPPPFPPYGGQPQFGQQYQPRFGPLADSKNLRPQLRWIAIAWGFAVMCVVTGVILFAGGLLNSVGDVAPTRAFAAGEQVTVPLDPAESPAIYLASRTRVHYECQIANGATLLPVSGNQNLTVNGTQWQQVLRINAPSAGDYQVTRTVQEDASVRFGVGRDMTTAMGGVLGGVAMLVLIPGIGILAAIIVTIVVLVRRNSQRKRLAVSE